MEDTFLIQIERDLLVHIIDGLRAHNLSVAASEKLARDFLAILPVADKQELLNKLNELGKTYTPAQQAYTDFIGSVALEKRDTLLNTMRDHIKTGNIEAAIAVAKGGAK